MTHIGEVGQTSSDLKRSIIPDLIECLRHRFVSFDQVIFQSMMWIDPANWGSDDESSITSELQSIQVGLSILYLNVGLKNEYQFSLWI